MNVVDRQLQGPVRAGCGPQKHGQVVVGVPGSHDRALPDMAWVVGVAAGCDKAGEDAGLLPAVVMGLTFSARLAAQYIGGASNQRRS